MQYKYTPPPDSKPFSVGKTKSLFNTDAPGVVAFRQNDTLVTADGTTLHKLQPWEAKMFGEFHNQQCENLFDYMRWVGINNTFMGRDGDFLFHYRANTSQGGALKIEFVTRLLPFGTMLQRQPEFADAENPENPSKEYFNADGTIRTFADQGQAAVRESFHKKCLVVKEDDTIDMISEEQARNHPENRYFQGGKLTKGLIHEDPMLITYDNEPNMWYVHDQKSPVIRNQHLAKIDRKEMMLLDANGKFIRKMDNGECIDRKTELYLQQQSFEVAKALEFACLNTQFPKAEFRFDGDGNSIEFVGNMGWAQLVDIKCEFSMSGGVPMLSDDLVVTNLRLFFNGNPKSSMRGATKNVQSKGPKLQNAGSPEQLMLMSAMFAKGSENFVKLANQYKEICL